MKILLSGGGTLGPVTPLLALVEHWRSQDEQVDLIWAGTKTGPEEALIEEYDIPFMAIESVKAPRYASLYWLVAPYKFVRAFWDARRLLKEERPDMIVTAGGYVSVPLVVLGRLMKIRSWVHQQDVLPGMSNKIMARFATHVSVTFDASRSAFTASKSEVTGNAVRPSMLAAKREASIKHFELDADRPTLLVFGGGSGSSWMNASIARVAHELTKEWQVLHITGIGKEALVDGELEHYVVRDLVGKEFAMALAASDVVLCRAGLGTLTELAHVGKPAIVVPLPDSHQEMNAFHLYEHQSAIILDQTETTPQMLLTAIRGVIESPDTQMRLTANMKLTFPKDGTAHIANGVLELAREAEQEWEQMEEGHKAETGDEEVLLDGDQIPALEESDAVVIDASDVEVEEVGDVELDDLSIQERIARAMGKDGIDIDKGDDDEDLFHVSRL